MIDVGGYEAMAMVSKGQLRKIGDRDMKQAILIAGLFQVAA